MADVTITALPNASALTGAERVPMDQSGTTVDASSQAIANLATAASVGLGNCDNTSDANKPISTATAAALAAKVSSVGLSLPGIFTVSGSPVTSSGTLSATLVSKAANVVFAGPTTGADATPAFRLLVAGDIPTISTAKVSGLASVATSGAYADLSGRPTLGTAAQADAGDFAPYFHYHQAQYIQGLGDLATANAATPPALGGQTPAAGTFTTLTGTTGTFSNLSASVKLSVPSGAAGTPAARDLYAVSDSIRYRDSGNVERLLLNSADNLANLGSTATARTNLGLGDLATANAATPPTLGPTTCSRLLLPAQGSTPSTPGTGLGFYANASNALSWIGANGYTRTFDGTANTANRSYTLPDASGTLALTTDTYLAATTRTANTFLAGPATGSAAAGTFRAMVAADLPVALWSLRSTVTAASSTYTLDITAANEFLTAAAIAGSITINLSNLASLPSGYVWRGVLRFAYTSGTISWFSGNTGYTVKWDGGTAIVPTASDQEAVVIEVVGGGSMIEVAALRGRA